MRFKTHKKISVLFSFLVVIVIAFLYFYLDRSLRLSQPSEYSAHLEKFFWIAMLAAAVLSFVLNFFLSRWVTSPVERISRIAQGIAGGDFSKRASIASDDEISDLARAIDFMSRQISQRIDEVTAAKGRLEAVFLSMVEGVMVVSGDGRILLMNETLKKILRVEHEPIGRHPLEVIRNVEVHEIVERVLRKKTAMEANELTFLFPEEKILRVQAAPVLGKDSTDGAVLVFHDITDLRRLETIRKDFVANVSHELRTPVANIKGYSETLLDGALEDKEHARDFLKIIYSESDHLSKLVDDLLKLARHEVGRSALDLKPCSIAQILDWGLAGLAQQIKQRELKVRLDIPQNLSQVRADDSAVAQIFLNLVENAIKYNKPGGEIIISAHEKGDWVEVCFADTGIGIPSDDVPRIFERFYRVDKSHSRDTPGTGLGLSIVKHIVQAHGGEIRAQSQLGQGTTICFTLPKV